MVRLDLGTQPLTGLLASTPVHELSDELAAIHLLGEELVDLMELVLHEIADLLFAERRLDQLPEPWEGALINHRADPAPPTSAGTPGDSSWPRGPRAQQYRGGAVAAQLTTSIDSRIRSSA